MRPYNHLIIHEFEHSAEIILNRPEKRNALNDGLVSELKHAFTFFEAKNHIKTLSLKAMGKAFCSGADLNHLKKMKNYSRDENLNDSMGLAALYYQIYSCSKPVIAVVQGPALAGGCGLASVCDFVLATENAQFGYPEVKIGFIAALVSAFLKQQIGERKARELLLTGKLISASEALNLGLINEMCRMDTIGDREQELISSLLNNSTLAMNYTKKLFDNDIEQTLKNLARKNADFRETPDFIEGISSFIEKRKPSWQIS